MRIINVPSPMRKNSRRITYKVPIITFIKSPCLNRHCSIAHRYRVSLWSVVKHQLASTGARTSSANTKWHTLVPKANVRLGFQTIRKAETDKSRGPLTLRKRQNSFSAATKYMLVKHNRKKQEKRC